MRFPMLVRTEDVEVEKFGKETRKFDSPSKKKKDRYAIGINSPMSLFSGKGSSDQENMPMIDRVPTAIGYHSDGSEDEWIDEKSRCSRYDSLAQERVDDDDLCEVLSDDEQYEGDDKYASKAKGNEISKERQQDIGIERLWSESTDSGSVPVAQRQWRAFDEQKAVESYYQPGDVSFLSESKNDPIYENTKQRTGKPKTSNAKQTRSKTPVVLNQVRMCSPRDASSPPRGHSSRRSSKSQLHKKQVVEERQSKTKDKKLETRDKELETEARQDSGAEVAMSKVDPALPSDPLSDYKATDTLVKEIEEKLKILKKAAAKEKKAVAKKIRENERQLRQKQKKNTKEPRKAVCDRTAEKRERSTSPVLRPSKNLLNDSKAGKVANGNRAKQESENKSNSPTSNRKKKTVPKRSEPKVSNRKPRVSNGSRVREAKPTEAKPGEDVKHKRPSGHGTDGKLRNLFPVPAFKWGRKESIESKEAAEKPTLKEDISAKSTMTTPKSMMYKKSLMSEDSDTEETSKAEVTRPLSPEKPEMELYMNSLPTEDTDKVKKEKSRTWKFGRFRTSKKVISPVAVEAVKKDTAGKSPITSPTSGLAEMDEYSGLAASRQDEPALVQCLKFYACGAVADKVNVAIETGESCQPMLTCSNGEILSSNDIVQLAVTPRPTVEVILEELDTATWEQSKNPFESLTLGKSKNPFESLGDSKDGSGSIESSTANLQEAPDLSAASGTSSFVVDVTDLNLQLDNCSAGDSSDHDSRLSITSIDVPTTPTSNLEDQKETSEEKFGMFRLRKKTKKGGGK